MKLEKKITGELEKRAPIFSSPAAKKRRNKREKKKLLRRKMLLAQNRVLRCYFDTNVAPAQQLINALCIMIDERKQR